MEKLCVYCLLHLMVCHPMIMVLTLYVCDIGGRANWYVVIYEPCQSENPFISFNKSQVFKKFIFSYKKETKALFGAITFSIPT